MLQKKHQKMQLKQILQPLDQQILLEKFHLQQQQWDLGVNLKC